MSFHISEGLEFVFVCQGCPFGVRVISWVNELIVDFVLFLEFLDDLELEVFGVLLG